ncbi:MAG: dTMP kinase [Epulopiscium sp. Nuni2H_MBin003]|nr:MAG: dTMP kinase [Epulopiscium sp. Nuni2H_MBin003]
MKKGYFIALEGGEGTGKTTIANLLKKEFKNTLVTREPGGLPVCEAIRNSIMQYNMDAKTELLLFLAARQEHVKHKILPAIFDGKLVICDRFYLSTLAYQGYASELGIDKVRELNSFVCDYMPDVNIFIDLPPQIGLSRKNKEVNKLDLLGMEFHEKVYEGYKKLIQLKQDDIEVVDGTLSIEQVAEEICSIIKIRCEI